MKIKLKGFTIVEIVIVLAVVAIIALVGRYVWQARNKPQPNSDSNQTQSQSSTKQAEYDKNNAITQQAISQKNPALCDDIIGSTTATYPLPQANGKVENHTSVYNQQDSITRCKDQAQHGSSYVY